MNIIKKEQNESEIVYTAKYLNVYKPKDQVNFTTPATIVTSSFSSVCGVELSLGRDYLITGTIEGKF